MAETASVSPDIGRSDGCNHIRSRVFAMCAVRHRHSRRKGLSCIERRAVQQSLDQRERQVPHSAHTLTAFGFHSYGFTMKFPNIGVGRSVLLAYRSRALKSKAVRKIPLGSHTGRMGSSQGRSSPSKPASPQIWRMIWRSNSPPPPSSTCAIVRGKRMGIPAVDWA